MVQFLVFYPTNWNKQAPNNLALSIVLKLLTGAFCLNATLHYFAGKRISKYEKK